MEDYKMGLFLGFGLIFVIFLITVFVRRKLNISDEHYDERQILARGKGYKISFLTVILLNIFYACFFYGLTKDVVSPQLVFMGIAFVGILVYSIYCIFKDAYIQVGQKIGRWVILLIFVIIANVAAAFTGSERGFNVDGFATGSSINILIAITFTIELIAVAIKFFIDKRGEAYEES